MTLEQAPKTKGHFVALDGMRGVAAVAVVLFHRREWTNPHAFEHAYLAVDFFFMLSGFVIALAYGERLKSGALSFTTFLTARAVRLYPLIVLGAAMGTVAQILRAVVQKGDPVRILLNFPFAALALPAPPSVTDKPFAINEPTWSLFFEIIANVAFALASIFAPKRTLSLFLAATFCLFLLMVNSVGAKVGFNYSDFAWGFVRVSFPFALGAAMFDAWRAGVLPKIQVPYWVLITMLGLIFAIPSTSADRLVDGVAIAVLFPLIITSGINSRLSKEWTLFAHESGRLSYPLYALHIPMMVVLGTAFDALGLSGWSKLLGVTIIIAGTTYLIGRWIDEPFRTWVSTKIKARRATKRNDAPQ